MAESEATTVDEKKRTPRRKRCSKCTKLKLLAEFPICATGKHGRYNYCTPCHAEYQKLRHPSRSTLDEKAARRIGLRKLGLKTCTSCKNPQPLEEFYKDPRHTDGKQTLCKTCWAVKSEKKYFLSEYGLTPEDYQKLLDAQDGVCAICGRAPKKNKFNVDHCHRTHRIRALLCVNCNTNLLPYVERYPQWVKNAFLYLENPPAFGVIGERMVPETNQARRRDQKKQNLGII